MKLPCDAFRIKPRGPNSAIGKNARVTNIETTAAALERRGQREVASRLRALEQAIATDVVGSACE